MRSILSSDLVENEFRPCGILGTVTNTDVLLTKSPRCLSMEWIAVLLVLLFAVLGSMYCFWSISAAWRETRSANENASHANLDGATKGRVLTRFLIFGAEFSLAVAFVVAAAFVAFETARTQGAVWWNSWDILSRQQEVSSTYAGPNGSRLIVHFARPLENRSVEFVDSTCQPIGDRDLAEVVDRFPGLKDLLLGRTDITDAGLVELQRCRNLESLSLQGLPITGRGLKHLATHRDLVFLDLSGTRVTDADLEFLTCFPNLEELRLCDTPVSDAGLAHLGQHDNLAFVALTGTDVTNEGVSHLQQALPDCVIERKPPFGLQAVHEAGYSSIGVRINKQQTSE